MHRSVPTLVFSVLAPQQNDVQQYPYFDCRTKGHGPKGRVRVGREWDSRVRALSEKAKRPLTQPLPGGHDAQPVSPQKAEAPSAIDRERR
jgi:hypothetical protein